MAQAIVQLVDSRQGGGIETHILQLTQALKEQGYPVIVVFLKDYGPHPLKEQLDGAGIHWQIAPQGLIATARFLRQHGLLINTHGYKAGILGRLAGYICRIPVVSTWHAGESGTGRMRLYQWLDRLTAPLAPAMAVSMPIAQQLCVPVTVIRNFISIPKATPPLNTGRIGFVGRLSHEKGPDLFCQLASQCGHGRAELFGEGPLRSLLEKRYQQIVRFHGYVADMTAHWPSISVLCISSRAEGLPLVALEAMARGIPVIAFAVGALPELIKHGENGFLAPPGDIGALKSCLAQWQRLSAIQRQQLANNARQTICQHYSAQAALPAIVETYKHTGALRALG